MSAPHGPSRFQWWWAGLAVLVAGLWLWINFCRFPSYSWNDIRLVPTFMAVLGEPVYTLPGAGVITTWMYGPAPLWIWSPAVLGSSAISALLIADFVNLSLTVVAIALTCAYWPVTGISRTTRWFAFAAIIAVWPDHAFRFLQADNIAIAFALFAQLLLINSSRENLSERSWVAAAATAVAMACKQTSLGILIAQLIWLACEYDRKTALTYLAQTLSIGGLLAIIAIWQFGAENLWFGMLSIAAHLPWAENPGARIIELAPILLVQWGAPLLAIICIGKRLFTKSHPLQLPLLAWLCCLPLGIFGLLTTGGSTNNMQSFHLIAAPLILVGLSACSGRVSHFYRPLTSALIIGVIGLRILQADIAPIRPALTKVEEATTLQAAYPQQIWLPWNPLVSYFEDNAFYHSEDGLYVRFITGNTVSVSHAKAHLPSQFRAMAFPSRDMQWNIANLLAEPGHQTRQMGDWIIYEWSR